MVRRSLLFALALAMASSGFAYAGPEQQTGQLAHGGTYVLRPDPASSQAAFALWFRAPGSGYDGATPGLAQLALAACAAAPLAGGKSLIEQIRALGGTLAFGGESDMSTVDVSVPVGSARRALAALTAAYFAPHLNDDAYKLALRDTAVRGVERGYSADVVLQDAVMGAMFRTGPIRDVRLPGSVAALSGITTTAISAYAGLAFRSTNAYLALAGNVDASMLGAITDGDATTAPLGAPIDSSLATAGTTTDVPGTSAGIGIGFAGAPISDQRSATALDFIADYLFNSANGVVGTATAASKADVSGRFITLHDPGVTFVTITGGDLDTAQAAVLSAVATMQAPLSAATFATAKRGFVYRSARNSSYPVGMVDDLAWYALQGAPEYAPGYAGGTYAKTIASLDPSFVASVARRYLVQPTVVRLIVEKGTPS